VNVLVGSLQVLTGSIVLFPAYFSVVPGFHPDLSRAQGSFEDPLVFALFLIASVAALPSVRTMISRTLFAALVVVGLLESGSRSGLLLGVPVTISVLLLTAKFRLSHVISLAALGGVFSYAVVLGLADKTLTRFETAQRSSNLRQEAYSYIGSHLGEYLITGGGYASSFALKNSGTIRSSLENGYLMLAVDIGIIAALVYLFVQLRVVSQSLASRQSLPSALGAIAAIGMASTFSSIATRSSALVVVWMAVCMAMLGRSCSCQPHEPELPPLRADTRTL
jgi:hypothetical protein